MTIRPSQQLIIESELCGVDGQRKRPSEEEPEDAKPVKSRVLSSSENVEEGEPSSSNRETHSRGYRDQRPVYEPAGSEDELMPDPNLPGDDEVPVDMFDEEDR